MRATSSPTGFCKYARQVRTAVLEELSQPTQKQARILHVTISGYTFNMDHLPVRRQAAEPTEEYYYHPSDVGDQNWRIRQAVFTTYFGKEFGNISNTDKNIILRFRILHMCCGKKRCHRPCSIRGSGRS